MTRCRGKALFLDLGFGRRQLMALLAKAPANQNHGDHKIRWGECSPFNVLAHLYGEAFADYGPDGKSIWKLVRYRGPRDVEPSSENLPCLVTFADMNDSKCV